MPGRSTGAKALVSAVAFLALLALLAALVDWRQVFDQLRRADRSDLALGTLLLLLGYAAFAWRWQRLMRPPPPFGPVFHVSNLGNMANTLLPLRPGDALRAFLMRGVGQQTLASAASSLVVERWYEQIMRLAALGGAVVFGAGLAVSPWSLGGMAAFLLGSWALMVWMTRRRETVLAVWPARLARLPRLDEPGARAALAGLIDGFAGIASPARMLAALLYSFLCWALFWGYHYLCLRAIAAGLPGGVPPRQALALSLASLALAPPSAATLPGLYQVSIGLPLALLGFDRSLLAAYTLLMNMILMIVVNGLGAWGALRVGVSLESIFSRSARTSQARLERLEQPGEGEPED
ncbi:MAG: lysylphosphatidylglycerol synthase transmembrane domain-containing protein [Chloroflexota bacterium]